MKYERIVDLIHEIKLSGISEFELQKGDFRIIVKNKVDAEDGTVGIQNALKVQTEAQKSLQNVTEDTKEILVKEGTIVRSSLVGVFHSLGEQDDAGRVAVGARIEEGQILGAIEAMKLMNDVVAACSGTVTEILVKDGELVEYGQPLFMIEG